jgi:uncharacterized protein (DUF1697 family)
MDRYVALLRGVNVGPHKKLAMADLRRLLAGLGYDGVRTYIQSGNAVFGAAGRDPAGVGREIEKAIEAELGMAVPVLVRSAAELRTVAEGNPLVDRATRPSFLYAIFLADSPDPGRLAAVDPAGYREEFVAGERVMYVLYPEGMGKAVLTHAVLEKKLGVLATARNWNTVTRLLELAEQDA